MEDVGVEEADASPLTAGDSAEGVEGTGPLEAVALDGVGLGGVGPAGVGRGGGAWDGDGAGDSGAGGFGAGACPFGGSGTNSPGFQVCGWRRTVGSLTNRSAWPHPRQTRVPSDSSPPLRSDSPLRPSPPVFRFSAQTKSLPPQLLQTGTGDPRGESTVPP